MSDTPRTDAESCWLFEGLSEVVTADFARGLERELAEARRDAERWKRRAMRAELQANREKVTKSMFTL